MNEPVQSDLLPLSNQEVLRSLFTRSGNILNLGIEGLGLGKHHTKFQLPCIKCKEVEIWYGAYPDLNLQFCARVAPGPCPGVGLEAKMYNRSD